MTEIAAMAGLDWLIARPVAHRGLHDAQKGVIENTSSAFAAAIAGGYGIECDLQVSADGEAMVHHDDVLGRLTAGDGRLDALTAAELKRIPYKATGDRMITLTELCELVAGRSTLVIELKSRFGGDLGVVGIDAGAGRADQRHGIGLWLVDLDEFLQGMNQFLAEVFRGNSGIGDFPERNDRVLVVIPINREL